MMTTNNFTQKFSRDNMQGWEDEALAYLRANKDAREPKTMAVLSALSDAQAFLTDNPPYANFLMNVAKYLVAMDGFALGEAGVY